MSERGRVAQRFAVTSSIALLVGSISSFAMGDMTKAQCADANVKAQDLRRDGRLSEAREPLIQCADTACPALVRNDCARRLDELNTVQPTVVFEAKDGAGKDLVAVKVSVDGKWLADSLTGTPLLVDPGAHAFKFEVAGQAPVVEQLVLHEGEKGRAERIVIGPPAPKPAPDTSATLPSMASDGAPPQPGSPSSKSNPTKRILGFVVGGAGVGLLGLGGYFQLSARSHDSDSKNAANSSDPQVQSTTHGLYVQASQDQTKALISAGVGVAAVAAGLVLVLTSGSSPSSTDALVMATPFVARETGGVQIAGRW